ncbi:hypothetical protein [Vibrio phage vB_VpaP_SJSY21]|nr:hypothetical protein [Vibrio phage vB_VpaP_SJSY21]
MTIFQGFVQEQGSQAHYDNGMLGTLNRNDYMIGELFEEVPILKKIAKGTSYGLVCGGYIRDIDTGRNPKK